jgi:4a-hydroxytetrahydrobiopterin dehydratase
MGRIGSDAAGSADDSLAMRPCSGASPPRSYPFAWMDTGWREFVALLDDGQIERGLAALPGWAREGRAIARTWEFGTFAEAIAFVNRVADLAEQADHHPDIDVRYRNVRLVLSTHSAGGITSRDLALAGRIDDSH